jgi:hypothetical protein
MKTGHCRYRDTCVYDHPSHAAVSLSQVSPVPVILATPFSSSLFAFHISHHATSLQPSTHPCTYTQYTLTHTHTHTHTYTLTHSYDQVQLKHPVPSSLIFTLIQPTRALLCASNLLPPCRSRQGSGNFTPLPLHSTPGSSRLAFMPRANKEHAAASR